MKPYINNKNMKKLFLLSAMITLSTGAWAQDDMYFVPSKKNIEKEITAQSLPKDTYYSGSDRSVDDYNRRSVYQSIDSLGNDIIEFNTSKGSYPVDSLSEDYQVTRRMERFDDYTVKDAYIDGYRDGTYASMWHSPWYYTRYGYVYTWYDPWFDPWYDPWYYTSWYGWYPYRYGWYGYGYRWGYPRYSTAIRYYNGRNAYNMRYHNSHSSQYYRRGWGNDRISGRGIGRNQTTTGNRSYRGWNQTSGSRSWNNQSRPSNWGGSRSSSMGSHSGFGGGRSGGGFGGARGGGIGRR